jgi:6,7-dimethyl-8-ribityllumazine synthase
MPTVYEGSSEPPAGRFAIIAAHFNKTVVDKLVAGALEGLLGWGVADSAIELVWVPGSFEVPVVAQRLAASGRYVAVICLGAVIRGETDHYEYVASTAATGIAQAGISTGVPVVFGVLTCDTFEQAFDRAGGNFGNKGHDAALTAIQMVNLLQRLPR